MYNHYDTYNSHLTNLAQGIYLYPEQETNLAKVFFPAVEVATIDGSFDRWETAPALTPVDTLYTGDNSPRRIKQRKTLGSWHCQPHALEIPTSGIGLMQGDHATRLREAKLRTLMSAQFASRQQQVANALNAHVAANTGMGAWGADTDIISEIDALCKQVVSQTAKRPNTLAIGIDAWDRLKNHASVLSRTNGLDVAVGIEAFQKMLLYKGLQVVLLDSYIVDPASKAIQPLLANDVFALYNAATPDMEDMSFGKEFTLSAAGPEVLSYKEHGGASEVDMLMWSSDMQVVNAGSCARMTVTAA